MSRHSNQQTPLKVGLISLGCAKNLVDAEIMLGSLLERGLEITSDAAEADALIVNTCSFIDSAQEESVDAILESAAARDTERRRQALIVSGCLPQRFREQLPALLPEVDAFIGIDQIAQIPELVREAVQARARRLASAAPQRGSKEIVSRLNPPTKSTAAKWQGGERKTNGASAAPGATTNSDQEAVLRVDARPDYIPDYATPRFRLTAPHYAYVKIAEGCNHPCSFCTIPRMRGAHRSRSLADIVEEARRLVAQGVKELNLISQDSTYYGMDLIARRPSVASPEYFQAASRALPADAPTLAALLRALAALAGDFWIRLLYTHPAHWTDELIETIAGCAKVARYVDMPLQHINGAMLERMRRETSREQIVRLIAKIRAAIPGIVLRTTFIVGFPGETEARFSELLDFIGETRFERLGVFTYSREQGTRAGAMAGQISQPVKEARRHKVMELQKQISRDWNRNMMGRALRVLVESAAPGQMPPPADVRSWERRRPRPPALEQRGEWALARGPGDAPDIDGRIYVSGALPAGQFAWVTISGYSDYDLTAVPLSLAAGSRE